MENIRHFFGVDLSTPPVRSLSKEDNGEFLSPYKEVVITIDEQHVCPFCGKPVDDFHCECRKFKSAFAKLQESCSDEKHKSRLHATPLNMKMSFSKSISDFKITPLTKEEILQKGLDLWDFAIRHTDRFSDRSYLVSPAVRDGNKLSFLCKDLLSKKVCQLEIDMIDYKDKTVYLGIYGQRTVSGRSGRIGDYRIEYYWNDLKEFEDWNDVCKVLKKFWKLASDDLSLAFLIIINSYNFPFNWKTPNQTLGVSFAFSNA